MSDQPSVSGESLTLFPSKVQCVAMSIASLVCAFFLFKVWWDGIEYAWVAGAFLAASAIYYAVHLHDGSFSMTLDPDGFTIVELYNAKRYTWANISDIVLRRGVLGPSIEFYDLTDGGLLRVKMNQTYGYRPRQLAAVMMEWRQKGGPTSTPQPKNIWGN